MSIYNINGEALVNAYSIDGINLQYAYNIEGQQVFPSETTLRVMTYNVGQWYIGDGNIVPSAKDSEYYNLQNGMIQRANADILFINEYRNNISSSRTAESMLSQYFPYIKTKNGSSGYTGRAICSKYPLSNYTVRNFVNGNTGNYYDSAQITVNGKTITLCVVHLMVTSEPDRYLQAQELCSFLNTQDTFIAGGDYNTGMSSDRGNDNTESTAYEHFVKLFTDEGYHTANFDQFGFMTTCNDGVDGAGTDWDLDNIITSADINILSAYVDTTKLTDEIHDKTDHMPLIATLQI